MTPSTNRSLVYQLLEEFCAQNSLRLTAADPYGHAGQVEGLAGKRWFFKGTRFDLNSLGASEIANDKAYAAKFLAESGLPVPATCFLVSADISKTSSLPEHLQMFTRQARFPLFVKPNTGREGCDVVRVDNTGDLRDVLETLANRHDHLLVQEEIRGRELRVVILEGEILCVFERLAPVVIGDGTRGVAELMKPAGKLNPDDQRIAQELAAQGMTLESVPSSGQAVSILPVANLSAGGSARIVTDDIEPEILSIARRATEALALRYAGVDLIVSKNAGGDNAAVVLEVNAAPGLSNLARQGKAELSLVKEIYNKIFSVMFLG